MSTRSAPVKRPATKKAPAAGKRAAAAKKPAAAAKRPAKNVDEASLSDLLARLGRLELAGLAGRLVQGWRKDIETIVQANRKSYAGLQALVEQQMSRVKERIAEIQSVGKVMSVAGPKESVRQLDDLALASVELALNDIRELAAAAAQSQREAFDLVQQRVNANIEEVQQLLRK